MKQPPKESTLIPAHDLRAFAAAALKAAGLRPDHAEQLGELLTNGDLRGVRSHGVRQLGSYCPSLRDGQLNPNPELAVLKDTDNAVRGGGDRGRGDAPQLGGARRSRCCSPAEWRRPP